MRLAEASRDAAVLRLAVTVTPGEVAGLADDVLDRVVGASSPVGTVILALEGSADVDERCRQALHSLHARLSGIGVRLLLVATTQQARQQLRDAGKDHPAGTLAVRPSLRSAVLATYAALPGPGLVTGRVRTALDLPAEPLTTPKPTSAITAPMPECTQPHAV